MSHRLLLGEREWSSRPRGGEARVGVHGLVRRMLRVGVLRQESNRRVGLSGLRLGEVFHVADALVAHVFSWVQQLFWMPPRVLRGEDKRKEESTAGSQGFLCLRKEGWLNPKEKCHLISASQSTA